LELRDWDLASALIAHEYRILIEEDALQKAFGTDYEIAKREPGSYFQAFESIKRGL
jgi:hypothetical protein